LASLPSAGPSLRYVALGDSYTIGTSVGEAARWPDQLVARLAADPPALTLELVANLAVDGSTAGTVERAQLAAVEAGPAPGFVSLLVGVNDVVQGVDPATYRGHVETILDRLLALLPPDRILCVETPDYTVTPMGGSFGDPASQRAGIVRNNATLRAACEARAVHFVDGVLAISAEAELHPELVASDGLHPSGEQYRRWVVERIEPAARELLAR
jgi:lysophospholipase L1-like esterase